MFNRFFKIITILLSSLLLVAMTAKLAFAGCFAKYLEDTLNLGEARMPIYSKLTQGASLPVPYPSQSQVLRKLKIELSQSLKIEF